VLNAVDYAFRGDAYLIGKADGGDVDAIHAISDYKPLTDAQKMKYVGFVLGNGDLGWRDKNALLHIWETYGDGLIGAARANGDLWARSVKANTSLAAIGPFTNAASLFTIQVRQMARSTLDSNDAEITRQFERLGADENGMVKEGLNASDQARLAAMQKAAVQILAAQDYQKGLFPAVIGYEDTSEYAANPEHPHLEPRTLADIAPELDQGIVVTPPGYKTDPGSPTFEDLVGAYNVARAVVRGNMAKWPALYSVAGGVTKPDNSSSANMQSVAGAPEDARKQLLAALKDTKSSITNAKAKIEGDPDLPLELTPLHERLMSGSGSIPWGDPVYRPIVEATVRDHNESEALQTLGLTAISGLAIVLAEFATGGLATFLLVGGVATGALATGQAIDKAVTASELQGAAISEDTRLIEEGKADEATVNAALQSVLTIIDLAVAAKAMAGIGKVAATGVSELDKLAPAERVAKIEESVEQMGAAATLKGSGKSLDELLAMLPAESKAARALKLLPGEIAVETGVASAKAIKAGAEAAEGLAKEWTQLGTVEARINWLQQRVDAILREAGVPNAKIVPNPDLSVRRAFYNQAQHEISIGTWWFQEDRSIEEIMKLTGISLHEARHAEQWFLMARRLAAKSGTAEQFARLGLPQDIEKLARSQPLFDTAAEASAADRWLDSIVSDTGRQLRKSAYAELDAAKRDLAEAQKAYTSAKDGGNPQAITDAKNTLEDKQVLFDAAYETYKKLPEEMDAFGVNEAIEARVRAWQNTRMAMAVGVGVGVGAGVGGGAYEVTK